MAPSKRNQPAADATPSSPARPARVEPRSIESPLKRLKAAVQQRVAARIAREELVLSSVEGEYCVSCVNPYLTNEMYRFPRARCHQ
jgi:hypothetical protein